MPTLRNDRLSLRKDLGCNDCLKSIVATNPHLGRIPTFEKRLADRK
jgi:hypothetical protein